MSDLIDRQALLKQIDIDSDGEPGYYGDTWKFIDTIKNMPNVHDLPKDTDTISRQAAIDGKICIRRSNGVEIYDDYVVPVEYLKQLPPAQPEPSQVAKDIARIVENGQDMRVIAQPEIIRCKDCKYRGVGDYCVYGTRLAWVTKSNDFCSKAERRTDE